MAKLILVKHAPPDILPGKDPHTWLLSDEGRRLAERLGKQLRPYQPQKFYSSPEPKALETAEIAAAQLSSLPVEIHPDLHEQLRHAVPFGTQAEFHQQMEYFFSQPGRVVYGQESADQAYARFKEAVELLLQKTGNLTTVIVAHGTVISLFVARLAGLDPFPLWKRLGLPAWIRLSLPGLEIEEVQEQVH